MRMVLPSSPAVLYLAKGKNFQANHNILRSQIIVLWAVLYLAKGKNFQANHNWLMLLIQVFQLCFT